MCMWDSTTCASHAALHVHVKQDCAPGNRADALNNLLLYMYFSYCYLIEYLLFSIVLFLLYLVYFHGNIKK